MARTSGGYPASGGGSSLPVATLSATDRWRALGGSEGAPRQLAEGCRWVGGAEKVDIDFALLHQCTENSEAGKVTDLNMHFKFVQQISGLEQLAPNLRSLNLSTNNIRVMEGFEGMSKLRELKLHSCQISRIQNLEQCVSLMALHLDDNHIGAIEGLDSLRCLEHLNMESNRLTKIGKGLGRLTRLKELHLSRNQITSLDGVAGLANLEICSLDHNRLSQVTAEQVKGLGKLDELRIAGNQLASLGFLATSRGEIGSAKPQPTLPSLVQLDASGNRLCTASLRNLQPLQQLNELNLGCNQIEEIAPHFVSSFPSLEILDLSGNLLHRGAEDLAKLKELSSLRELLIEGNPFASQSEPAEVQQALSVLCCLEFLDDQPLEKVPEADILVIREDGEDTETFPLTVTKGVSNGQEQKRPDSSGGSRPSTAASQRPGTAQKMSEAGVRDPLMLAKPKLSNKRYASLEQVEAWERATISGLLAVQKQIDKTSHHIDADLKDMSKFLHKADKCLEREKDIQRKRSPSPDEDCGPAVYTDEPQLPTLSSAAVTHANSGFRRGLREAVERGREDSLDDDACNDPLVEAGSPPLSPTFSSSSRLSPAAAAAAACDEEISEDEPVVEASPVPSSPEPAEEVDEELNADEAPSTTLGPRAARAKAAAASKVAGDLLPSDLRVDKRASARAAGQQRPSSRDSRGRVGVQPRQTPKVRPVPAAPILSGRSSTRASKP